MITEKWHDLRENPDDLPENGDDVWVILADNPNLVDVDSYIEKDKGHEVTEPGYDFVDEDGTKIHRDEVKYISSGWWQYGQPGMITHWMYIEKPEPPKEND